MTTTAPTFTPPAARSSWRENIRLTRITVFSILFILIGAWLIVGGAGSIGGEVVTRLTFGAGMPDLNIPTLGYSLVVGVLYIGGGIVGLLPNENLRLVRWVWLFVNGLLVIPTVLIIAAAGNSTNVTVMLQVSLRLATPIVMGALAGIWCERSGVVNIAIEGMMLSGACFGFVTMSLLAPSLGTSEAQLVGIFVAILAGGIMALLHGWLSITFKTDQVVSGTVINILALGLTSFVRREVLLSSQAGRETLQTFPIIQRAGEFFQRTPVLSNITQTLAPIVDAIVNFLLGIPILGDFLRIVTTLINEVVLTGRPVFYSMFILLIVTHIVLFHTRWGLRMRAVGENPRAADTVGINVNRVRWVCVVVGGLIAGLAGAWFSLETTGGFDDNMTSGRGFIALAAMIFGKYTPIGALGGGLLFGFSDALGQRFQFLGVPVPAQFLQMVPYVITVVVLAGLVGKAVAPKADGIPYEKEGK